MYNRPHTGRSARGNPPLQSNSNSKVVSLALEPNLEGQVLVFISPRNKVAQLHTQAPGSSLLAFYVSQGYGGGIRPGLHTGSVISYWPQIILLKW
jgi:hypothetical protein